MVHLVFVHGVNAQTTGYSNPLFTNILQAYEQQLQRSGLDRDQAQKRGRNLVQNELLWAQDTTDLTNRYLTLQYEVARRPGKWNFIGKAVDPLVVQILFYVKDKGHQRGPMTILKSFHESFQQIGLKRGSRLVLIAHSLGSVVAYDYLFRFRSYSLQPGLSVAGFVTMGSPIPIFAAAMGYPQNPLHLPPYIKHWVNILDPDDGVGRYIGRHDPNIKVEDVEVNTGWNPLSAHTQYWYSRQVAGVIADRLIQWKV